MHGYCNRNSVNDINMKSVFQYTKCAKQKQAAVTDYMPKVKAWNKNAPSEKVAASEPL